VSRPDADVAAHLSGAAVVVTGVGGLGQAGEAVARAFANAGAIVHCIGRGSEVRDRAAELVRDGLEAHAHTVDLTDFDATKSVAGSIAAASGGRISLVAALAGGFSSSGDVADSEPQTYTRQLSVNLTTAYSTARAFAAPVRAAKGVFVFVASATVLPGGKSAGLSAYAMAKGGLVELVRSFAAEERAHDVRVYAVAPTSIRTASNVASMGERASYIEREDFAATIIAMARPSFALATGEVLKLA
jgi:NAD(P)-dependent dehydrogenase (short-subunit alcohol dehydrogenase family)